MVIPHFRDSLEISRNTFVEKSSSDWPSIKMSALGQSTRSSTVLGMDLLLEVHVYSYQY